MKAERIEAALERHVPAVWKDETVRGYLVQILCDDDAYKDIDSLVEAVQPFLDLDDDEDYDSRGDETARALVRSILARGGDAGRGSQQRQSPQQHQRQRRQDKVDDDDEDDTAAVVVVPTPTADLRSISDVKQDTACCTAAPAAALSENGTARAAHGPEHCESRYENNCPNNEIEENNSSSRDQQTKKKKNQLLVNKPTRKEKRLEKQRQRRQEKQRTTKKKGTGEDNSPSGKKDDEGDYVEDDASAWRECRELGQDWGGRGRGGRGCYSSANSIHGNIHLTNINIALPNGTEILRDAVMDITAGRRYGFIGRNGCGKSTTLLRLAQKALPGMPHDMRVLLVRQQIDGSDQSAIDSLLAADTDRTELLREQEELETKLGSLSSGDNDAERKDDDDAGNGREEIVQVVNPLEQVAVDLDAIRADTAVDRAEEILRGLQFTDNMMRAPTSSLSGGWRMRLSLARALFVPSDLLLFDECTNHLDLHGLAWLIKYLNNNNSNEKTTTATAATAAQRKTLIVVSHDRAFLDAVCTDIMVMEHQRLSYHVGSYSEYRQQQAEKAARQAQILDAAGRQKARAEAFVQKQQQQAAKKSADPKKQRQAKMIKEKKMERIGNYREDGKRYKLRSLKTLSEDSVRLAQKVVIEADEPVVKMHFPDPAWPPGIGPNDAIVRMENFSFAYGSEDNSDNGNLHSILEDVTLSLHRGGKVACVGRNGSGKSTLAKLFAGDLVPNQANCGSSSSYCRSRGELWRHPNLRVGHVTQYSVEELEVYAHQTVVQYAESVLKSGRAAAGIVAKACGNVRQYLGAFGLGGKHALQRIGQLSGGERMRLCFATVLAQEPHLLLLDESTNHVDMETLDSMSTALNAYQGAVFMVSHNQGFLSGFCKELWVVGEEGRNSKQIRVHHSDTATFDEIFSQYRTSIMTGKGKNNSKSLTAQRQEKAAMAKRATKQRDGTQQNVALL